MKFNIKKTFFKINSTIKTEIINNSVFLFNKLNNKQIQYNFPLYIYLDYNDIENTLYILNDSFNYSNKRLFMLHKKLFFNLFYSLSNYFEKNVILVGIGYKFVLDNSFLNIFIGYSHVIKIYVPSEINLILETPNKLKVLSYNNVLLGNFCSILKSSKHFDIYKGKGIRFESDKIVLKETKKRK